MRLDEKRLARVFNGWASQYTHPHSSQGVALEGKSLKNTVSDGYGSQQNFVSLVSAFSHPRGEVLGLRVMENKKHSEITVVQALLELLDLKGVVFTMAALHCQKKP